DILSHNWFLPTAFHSRSGAVSWRYATIAETSPLGVAAHEYGHQLGLPDLYDRASTTRLGGGLGDWSLMASGTWLNGRDQPADLDARSKIDLGFVDARTPQTSGTLMLRAAAAAALPDVYRVWTRGEIGPEYLVIENRQRSGEDAFLPGAGMLVYHVDHRVS